MSKRFGALVIFLSMVLWTGAALADVIRAEDGSGLIGAQMPASGAYEITLDSTEQSIQYNLLSFEIRYDLSLMTIGSVSADGASGNVLFAGNAVGKGNNNITLLEPDTINDQEGRLLVTIADFGSPVAVGTGPILTIQFTVDGGAPLGTSENAVRLNLLASTPVNQSLVVENGDMEVFSHGITFTPVAGTLLNESGTTADFDVTLNTEPTADVTVDIVSQDTTEGIVSLPLRAAQLVFTNSAGANPWNVAQRITVTGQNDDIDDGSVAFNIRGTASSTDGNYDGLFRDQELTTDDDSDTAGVTVNVTDPTTGEDGSTASIEVVLDSEPTHDVVIGFTSADESEGVPDAPQQLTFTPANWDTPQSLTVTGQDDEIEDGNVIYNVDLDATSADAVYNGIFVLDATLTNNDDTDNADVTVTVTDSQSSEDGDTATVTVVLTSDPTGNVVVNVASNNFNEGQITSTVPLSFDPTGGQNPWNVAQTITVTGQNDDVDDGDVAYQLTFFTTTGDVNYDTLAINPANLTNLDNDDAGITINGADFTTSESGDTADFTVQLDSRPLDNVTIDFTTSDSTEGSITTGASITFTPDEWDMPKDLVVTGVNDTDQDGNQNYTVDGAITSTDGLFSGLTQPSLNLTNNDDEPVRFTITGPVFRDNAEAGDPFQITIVALDINDQPAEFDGNQPLIFSGPGASPFGNEATVDGTAVGQQTNINFANGQAIAQAVFRNAESTSLKATSVGLTPVVQTSDADDVDVDVSPTEADQLAFATAPTSPVVAGETWTAFSVEIVDEFGNRTLDTHTINVTTDQDDFDGGTTSVAATAGLATFNDLSYNTAENVVVQADNETDGDVNSVNSNTVTVNPAGIDSYTVTNPGAVTAGGPFNITIQAQDQFGNNITTGADAAETLDITLNVADAGLTPTTFTTVNGTATENVTLNQATTDTAQQSLTFTGQTSGKTGNSGNFDVNPNNAVGLGFSVEPVNTPNVPGSPGNVAVQVQDNFGNRIPGRTDDIMLALEGDVGTLNGTNPVAAVDGTATFNDLEVQEQGVYTLRASAAGLNDGVSVQFAIGNEPPSVTASSPAPAAVTVNEGDSVEMTITVDDAGHAPQDDGIQSIVWSRSINGGGFVELNAGDGATGGSSVSGPASGSFTQTTDNNTSTHAQDTVIVIRVTATDNADVASTHDFTITVTDVNTPPTINGTPITSIDEDTFYSFDITADDADDEDANNLNFSIVNNPGWMFLNSTVRAANDSVVGTPNNNDVGTTNNIIVSVTDTDGTMVSLTAFSVTVNNVNDAPTANDDDQNDGADTDEDTAKNIPVLDNDTDDDIIHGDTLEVTVPATSTRGGSLATDGTTVTYTPAAADQSLNQGEVVNDTFTYTATDDEGANDNATVTVTLTGVNDDPTAQNASIFVQANKATEPVKNDVDIYAANHTAVPQGEKVFLTGDDVDDENNAANLIYEVTSLPAKGQLFIDDGIARAKILITAVALPQIVLDGQFLTYQPDDGENGTDSFNYRVTDARGAEATAEARFAIGTPLWFPPINWTAPFLIGGARPSHYELTITGNGVNLTGQFRDEDVTDGFVTVQPEYYIGAGSGGLLPGTYNFSWSYFEPDATVRDFVAGAADTFDVEDYGNPAAIADLAHAEVAARDDSNRNREFTFTPENAAGFILFFEIENATGGFDEFLTITETFGRDTEADPLPPFPLNQPVTKQLYFAQTGNFRVSVRGFNPVVPSTQTDATAQGLFSATVAFTVTDGEAPQAAADQASDLQSVLLGEIGNQTVRFSWQGPTAAYRVVLRSVGKGTVVVNPLFTLVNGTSYEVPRALLTQVFGVSWLPADTYEWSIVAFDGTVFSDWAPFSTFNVEPALDGTVPNALVNLNAAQGNAAGGEVPITFTADADPAFPADSVEIQIFNIATEALTTLTITVGGPQFVDVQNLAQGANYAFRGRALNGTEPGPWTGFVELNLAADNDVQIQSVFSNLNTNVVVNLVADPAGAQIDYQISRGALFVKGTTDAINGTQFTIAHTTEAPIAENAEYYIRIRRHGATEAESGAWTDWTRYVLD